MPNSLQSVEAAALELSQEERPQLAQSLLASLPRDSEVEVATPASLEFLAAIDFYESRGVRVGLEFIEDVEQAVQLVAQFPSIGSPARAECICGGSPTPWYIKGRRS